MTTPAQASTVAGRGAMRGVEAAMYVFIALAVGASIAMGLTPAARIRGTSAINTVP